MAVVSSPLAKSSGLTLLLTRIHSFNVNKGHEVGVVHDGAQPAQILVLLTEKSFAPPPSVDAEAVLLRCWRYSMTKEDMSQPPDPQAAKLRSIEVALTDKRPCGS